MNPFDEFPSPDKLYERVANYEWVRMAFKKEALAWREKWELVILEAMEKAETLDLFYELGESARTMVEESVAEYMREREG